ncbi:uncharacterized protein LOC115223527 [Octopus sinensis]|uniref:Uncharacterized protein LOC115223527 n=1 Tax=Octopus sinensis TaxID=2607531 RepID=A0A6P7TIW8_9MOLL|nr:uncharacterized protein LOC115223527 [Octopus sinensis]
MKFAMWKKSSMWILFGGMVMFFLALSTCLACLLTGVYHRWQLDRKESFELQNIMVSLGRLKDNSNVYKVLQEELMESTVERVFPWLPKNNTLPNYFFHQQTRKSPVSYQHSNIVFMTNTHDSSSSFSDCLHDIATDHSLPMSPFMSIRNRRAWEEAEGSERMLHDRIKIHHGNYAFGMCENLTSSCSYFLMLQDPIERAISTYHYCKDAISDELCSVVNANKVSVHDWAVHQGSLFFRQLLFKPDFCDIEVNSSLTAVQNSNKLPCWYKQKLYFDSLSNAEITEALNYVGKHLDQWFSVVGHVDDYSASVKMFEHVYRLPFSKCHDSSLTFQEELSNNNRAYTVDQSKETLDKQEVFLLKQSATVQKALHADYRIYNEAKKLYQIQRQVLFNQIGH